MCNKSLAHQQMALIQVCNDTELETTVTLAPTGVAIEHASETRDFTFQSTFGDLSLTQSELQSRALDQDVIDSGAVRHWRVARAETELVDAPWTTVEALASELRGLDHVDEVLVNDVYDEEDQQEGYDNLWIGCPSDKTAVVERTVREQYPGLIPQRLSNGRIVVQPQMITDILSTEWDL